MEHPQEHILHAFVDRTLDSRKERELRAHLSRCLRCRREVAELTRLFDELKTLPSPAVNRRLTTRILLARQQQEGGHLISFDLLPFLFGKIGWAAMAVGLLAGILLGLSASGTWQEPLPPLGSSYAASAPEGLYFDYLISDNGDIL